MTVQKSENKVSGKKGFLRFDELSCVKIVGRETANHTETAKKQKKLLETEKWKLNLSKTMHVVLNLTCVTRLNLCLYVETHRNDFT